MNRESRVLEALARRAQSGDRAAFDEVVALVGERVRAVLITRGVEFAAFDDVLQETWLRAWERLGQLEWRGERAFVSWLASVAVNVSREGVARGKRRQAELIEEAVPSPDETPSQELRRDERFDRLESSLQALSPEHRRVILEARIRKKPIGVIAEEMGRSRAAVSQLLLRALKNLKEEFGETASMTLPRRALEEEAGQDG